MVWPFVSNKTTLGDVLAQLVKLSSELRGVTTRVEQQIDILRKIEDSDAQPARDLSQIRRLLWRLTVQPPEFEVFTRGESMGFMNKTLALKPTTEDVVKQVVTIASPGKVTITKELDAEDGQTVDFSVPAGTEVTISLQYFDEADNASTLTSRTFVVVDDVPPEGPATLADIASVSETDTPLFATLEDVPAESTPEDVSVLEVPTVDEPVVDETPTPE